MTHMILAHSKLSVVFVRILLEQNLGFKIFVQQRVYQKILPWKVLFSDFYCLNSLYFAPRIHFRSRNAINLQTRIINRLYRKPIILQLTRKYLINLLLCYRVSDVLSASFS